MAAAHDIYNVVIKTSEKERERKIGSYITDLPKILFERGHDDSLSLRGIARNPRLIENVILST